jgi:hypothetical protein
VDTLPFDVHTSTARRERLALRRLFSQKPDAKSSVSSKNCPRLGWHAQNVVMGVTASPGPRHALRGAQGVPPDPAEGQAFQPDMTPSQALEAGSRRSQAFHLT